MKVSLNWLREYIEINLSAKDISHNLTMLGMEIDSIEETKDDTIFEISFTINRGDCLSMLGLAQEISLINKEKVKYPQVPIQKSLEDIHGLIDISIVEDNLCPRYCGRLVKNVKITNSPSWMQKRLISAGIKPINNIVDITNFVLMEYGQPMHAFDYDLISGNKIIVRKAKDKETIETLEGKEVSLSSEVLVIADKEKSIAIAGIIGGSKTAVNNKTTNILLESANFNPITIRKTSQKLNIITESAYRFERDVDSLKTIPAIERATELILQNNPSAIISTIYDLQKILPKETIIDLDINRANSILGTSIPSEEIINILKHLKFNITDKNNHQLILKVPSFRKDIHREIDVIEEIARIYGYNRITTSLYRLNIDDYLKKESLDDKFYKFTNIAKNTLNSLGIYEIISYPFIRQEWLEYTSFQLKNPVTIQNPLNEEENIMSPTLLFGIMRCISHNLRKGNNDLKIYEIGKIYHDPKEEQLPNEITNLACAITGKKTKISWREKSLNVDIFDLTGIFEKLCIESEISSWSYQFSLFPCFSPQVSYQISHNGAYLGIVGEISSKLLDKFKISQKVFYFELNWDYILNKSINTKKTFKAFPKYPSNSRDIALVVKENSTYKMVLEIIQELNHPYIKEINLFDIYRGSQIPKECKSLAFSITYQSLEKTLSDEEVDKIHQLLINNLISKLKAYIR
ncbi:MAG: phenylalanine--tRNA ligase subunit beta [bacterium]|nr:phenylalanine--tRNA ligase subunit beta [bacterium]